MPDQIFLGNGDASAAACYRLHQKLEQALLVLGGVQQPCRCISAMSTGCTCTQDAAQSMSHIERLAGEIYEALTGNEIADA
jgi:hypothetical protein